MEFKNKNSGTAPKILNIPRNIAEGCKKTT
jgi:hypothetical protein